MTLGTVSGVIGSHLAHLERDAVTGVVFEGRPTGVETDDGVEGDLILQTDDEAQFGSMLINFKPLLSNPDIAFRDRTFLGDDNPVALVESRALTERNGTTRIEVIRHNRS